jgi:hypothetical protein
LEGDRVNEGTSGGIDAQVGISAALESRWRRQKSSAKVGAVHDQLVIRKDAVGIEIVSPMLDDVVPA